MTDEQRAIVDAARAEDTGLTIANGREYAKVIIGIEEALAEIEITVMDITRYIAELRSLAGITA